MFKFLRAFSECILAFCYIACSSGKRVYNNVTKNSTKRLNDMTREHSNIEYPSKISVYNLALKSEN